MPHDTNPIFYEGLDAILSLCHPPSQKYTPMFYSVYIPTQAQQKLFLSFLIFYTFTVTDSEVQAMSQAEQAKSD